MMRIKCEEYFFLQQSNNNIGPLDYLTLFLLSIYQETIIMNALSATSSSKMLQKYAQNNVLRSMRSMTVLSKQSGEEYKQLVGRLWMTRKSIASLTCRLQGPP